MLERAIATAGLAVRLSVTREPRPTYEIQDIEIIFTSYDRAMFLVSRRQMLQSIG